MGVVAVGMMAACGGTTAGGSPDHDGGKTPLEDATTDQAVPTPPVCPLGTAPTAESAANGTVTGPGVSIDICNAAAFVFLSTNTQPSGDLLFALEIPDSSTATFHSPSQGSDLILTIQFAIGAAAPGVYTSTGSTACGDVSFSYALPIPAGIDCQGMTGPSCPTGCSAACALQCSPCTPNQPEVDYLAQATSDCLGETQPAIGSWSLALTSVTPFTGGGGDFQTQYVVHGTLTASVENQGGGPDGGGGASATLSMTF